MAPNEQSDPSQEGKVGQEEGAEVQLVDTMPRTGRQAPMGEDKRSVVPQQG